ncbi:MAG: YezD family protein [Planctomycetota bacterium]
MADRVPVLRSISNGRFRAGVPAQPGCVLRRIQCGDRGVGDTAENCARRGTNVIHFMVSESSISSEASMTQRGSSDSSLPQSAHPVSAEMEQTILRALRGLKYGQITITVQEGQVTQIDRSEHTRQFRNKRPNK